MATDKAEAGKPVQEPPRFHGLEIGFANDIDPPSPPEFEDGELTCPNCGDEMVGGSADQVRFDLADLGTMSTSSASEERMEAEIKLQSCYACGFTRGTIRAQTYAGY